MPDASQAVRYAYTSLPNLVELRAELDIGEVNTGRTVIGPYGLVSDDMERLYALTDAEDRVRLMSGVEFSFGLYRGQWAEHLPCIPTLGRLESSDKQLLALCRAAAFEDAVASHPMVAMAQTTTFLGKAIAVDEGGLVQHYGLPTDMLDLTSSFDVAGFFATCRWDDNRCCYRPLDLIRGPGVIYRLHAAFVPLDRLRIVGWQPLPRPAEQRAFAIRLKRGEDFLAHPGVEKRYFRHSLGVSRRIWKAFDGGRVLFPIDAIAEMSDRAKRLTQFSRFQVDRAWKRLETWLDRSFDPEAKTAVEGRLAMLVVDDPILDWKDLGVEEDERVLRERMNEVFDKVRVRPVAAHCVEE